MIRIQRGIVAIAATLTALVGGTSARVCGQAAEGDWTPPHNLFETEGRASEAEVVADRSGVVHVVWAYGAPGWEEEGAAQSIYYARNEGDGWSTPVDVLVSPGGRVARMPSVAADRQGYLHAVWSGGDAVFYSRAYGPEAGSAWGWTPPAALVSGVVALEPSVAVAEDGTAYVIWTQAGSGLTFARSDDDGAQWTTSRVIFEAAAGTELARWGRIAVDGRGRLHVALTHAVTRPGASETRDDALFLYYLSSEDAGESWTLPLQVVAEPDFGEVEVAAFGEDVVHLAWNGRAGRSGRYHCWSTDGGQTWSEVDEILAPAPQDPLGTGGLTGFPAMVVDGTGTLHLVSTTGDGNYYFQWRDGAWSEPVLISGGLDGQGVTGEGGGSLEQPSVALSEGNRLHVVFHDGFERIWYTTREIDAPRAARQTLPTVTPADADSGSAEAALPVTPVVAAAPTRPAVAVAAPEVSTTSRLPVVLGASAALVLIVAVVVVRGVWLGRP